MGVGRIAVVGGGLAGLSCAHALARRGADVVLLEA
ncbi:MAG: FAD-dependent oxidoreductase, partial [Thermoanaerobaculia bacterium]|nr:FAD-dependent oxidoreductase [Thermoanaerobaculia bacterium]